MKKTEDCEEEWELSGLMERENEDFWNEKRVEIFIN